MFSDHEIKWQSNPSLVLGISNNQIQLGPWYSLPVIPNHCMRIKWCLECESPITIKRQHVVHSILKSDHYSCETVALNSRILAKHMWKTSRFQCIWGIGVLHSSGLRGMREELIKTCNIPIGLMRLVTGKLRMLIERSSTVVHCIDSGTLKTETRAGQSTLQPNPPFNADSLCQSYIDNPNPIRFQTHLMFSLSVSLPISFPSLCNNLTSTW